MSLNEPLSPAGALGDLASICAVATSTATPEHEQLRRALKVLLTMKVQTITEVHSTFLIHEEESEGKSQTAFNSPITISASTRNSDVFKKYSLRAMIENTRLGRRRRQKTLHAQEAAVSERYRKAAVERQLCVQTAVNSILGRFCTRAYIGLGQGTHDEILKQMVILGRETGMDMHDELASQRGSSNSAKKWQMSVRPSSYTVTTRIFAMGITVEDLLGDNVRCPKCMTKISFSDIARIRAWAKLHKDRGKPKERKLEETDE